MLDYYVKRLTAWFLPDPFYAKLTFLKNHGRLPCTPPVIFNEFLYESKCSGDLIKLQRYTDKVAVRDHVAEKIGPEYLVPLYGTAKRLTRDVWNGLPETFILKANHGSSWNKVVWNKSDETYSSIAALAHGWLRKNFYYVRREAQYKKIKPQLMFEKVLADNKKDVLEEYKFFCFHGKVAYILAIFSDDSNRRRCYDRDWNKLDVMVEPENYLDAPRPERLDEMIEVAETLAEDFTFVRVDLYAARRKVYFGELTFVPGGGGWLFRPVAFAEALGRFWAGEDIDLTRFHCKSESPGKSETRARPESLRKNPLEISEAAGFKCSRRLECEHSPEPAAATTQRSAPPTPPAAPLRRAASRAGR